MGDNTAEPRFVTLGEACRVLGMTRPTLRVRINAGELVSYDDPRDRRRVLLAAQDLEALSEPRPRVRSAGLVAA
jgi:excisionase family DNA binding protein